MTIALICMFQEHMTTGLVVKNQLFLTIQYASTQNVAPSMEILADFHLYIKEECMILV
jgi:hypothetical protein